MSNRNLTTSFRVLSVTCLLAISSVSQAAITALSDDFEGYGAAGVPSAPDFFPWLGFSDNGGFPGGYSFIPSTNGPGIAALGYFAGDSQYLNFYANYENQNVHDRAGCGSIAFGCSPNEQEAISVYRDMPFTAADTANGDTWVFSFRFREADIPPAGATEVGAYIRVFDPVRNLLHEVALDTSGSGTWRTGIISVTLDPAWTNGFFQVGFNNLVGNYEDSGMFYDDVNLAKALDPLVKIEGRGAANSLHVAHDDGNVSPFLDDKVPVVVYGSSTLVGDPVDMNVAVIQSSTFRFGPGNAQVISGSAVNTDVDNDGILDKRTKFLMSESGLGQPKNNCSNADSKANLTGESGDLKFAGSDNFTPVCNAGCHTGP